MSEHIARHLIHKKHDVKMKRASEKEETSQGVVNLIAKWLQLFILQMDSCETTNAKS